MTQKLDKMGIADASRWTPTRSMGIETSMTLPWGTISIGWTPTRSMGIETSHEGRGWKMPKVELPRAVWELKHGTGPCPITHALLNSHAQYGNWNHIRNIDIVYLENVELPRAVWELKLDSVYQRKLDAVELPRAVWELKPLRKVCLMMPTTLNSHAQ